ncbi:MAG TPA: Rieske (2Fe-2S) protein [Gammaproteobacteria bacterium]
MSHGCPSPRSVERRRLLQACCGLALCRSLAAAADEADEASSPPQEGDFLVFAYGARAAQPIAPEDVALDAPQILAYPMSPVTQRVRDGTRLNQLVVVRFDPALLSEQSRARSAEGVVAYSGVCTHTGCDVTDWKSDVRRFKCPCHESEFDPADGARVVGGPAPWPLAALPLKIVEGKLAVAGPFEGRVGFQQPGFDTLG